MFSHHSAPLEDGQGLGEARVELHGRAPADAPPQAAGAQYFAMDAGEDTGQAPAAKRPAPLLDVLPLVGLGLHGGIGSELVLASAVPQLGAHEAETTLPDFLKAVRGERMEENGKEKDQGKAGNKICTQNSPGERVQQRSAERAKDRSRAKQVKVQETPEVQGFFWGVTKGRKRVPYTSAKMRLPSLCSDDTCTVLKLCRAMGGNSGQTKHETPFPSLRPLEKVGVISVSRTSMKRFLGKSALAPLVG